MDDIFRKRSERENDYYVVMGGLEARMLEESGLTAARFLKSGISKIRFKKEITEFTENQLEILNGNYNSDKKKLALHNLKQEKSFLITQENMLRQKRAIQYASIEVQHKNGMLFYILKGVGFIAGVSQVIVGFGLLTAGSATVIGAIAGAALMVHGIGAIEENARALYTGNPDYKGYLRRGYEKAAQSLGYTAAQGELIYGGIDLVLSGYGLARNVLKPDAWRLFRNINTDYIRGFREMPPLALAFEMGVDGLTIKSANDTLKQMNDIP
ncbi:DUF4225 domain-containing protein [Rahnella sikkimica]|uniref:DUF4225 domain-containing protein n=1 Tax=Rahnella sikkimica TaxID=1805933 RepID=A0A2L1UUP5_9GAMM|nr:DUF4225 domain-containing protein [Rahnella sikkimica]AVF36683.1 hypothetical protein BV494_17905 [Rahnella sikkimica]